MKLKQLILVVPLIIAAFLLHLSGVIGADEKPPPPPKTIKAEKVDLTLNGSAIRTIFGFQIYQVGLYVNSPCKDEKKIFSDREKKRIQIKMLRQVTGKKFESTVRKNIAKNFSSKEQKQYSEENERFLGCFIEKILAKDSVVDIDFIPSQGTEVLVDGERVDLIPGDDYYHTLLRLWIGEPLQKSIKHGLLGKPEV